MILTIDRHFTDIVKPLSGLVGYSYLCGRFWGINYPREWTYDAPGSYDNSKDIYYYLVDPDHNPEKKSKWTSVYYDHVLRKWMTSYVIPIYKGEEFLGVFGNDIFLEQFLPIINESNILKTGYAFILDKEGNLVAHHDYQDLIARSGETMGDQLDTKNIGDKFFRSILDEIREKQFLKSEEIELSKKNFTLIKVKIVPFDWSLVFYIPSHELLPGFETWAWFYLSVLIVFVIFSSIVFYQFLHGSIFSPLNKLRDKMGKVKEAKYDLVREKIGKAEIEDLATSFYSMVDCIKQHGELVKKRTDELTIANEQLQQEVEVRKSAERALHKREACLRAIFEASDDVSFIITDMTETNASIVDFSPGAEQVFGYKREELIGKPISVLHLPEDAAKSPGGLKSMRRQREGFSGEYTLVRKSGEKFPALFKTYPIFDNEGGLTSACIIAIDITKPKKIEEELQKIDKLEAIGVLAGGIAHDFNNLLTGIIGNLSLAELYMKTEDSAFEPLTGAKKAAQNAGRLIQQLLTFSRGGAPIKGTASISELIKDTASFALRGSKVRCEYKLPDSLWPVDIDKGQISQVINNLIINAEQAMPEGGIIRINAQNIPIEPYTLPLQEGRYVMISIKDQGIGIPEEHLSKIFDPYFTTKSKGIGLGLTSCYSIVKKHGGHITVESELGLGTAFHIYLPASDKEILQLENIEEAKLHFNKGKILFMDDEQIVIDAAENMLTLLGYKVDIAKNGEEAIELYKKSKKSGEPFDAVILDLTVPGNMGGKETIKKLLEIDPEVRAIVSSGYSSNPIMAEYKKYGFKSVIAKPYEIQEVSEVLFKVITESGKPYTRR